MNKDFEKYMSEFVNVNEVDLYRIIKYQLGWEDEFGNKSNVIPVSYTHMTLPTILLV